MRKTLCRSHRIVHTFGLVSFHHTQAHTFGLNKLHSSALITSSHSSPTNKHHRTTVLIIPSINSQDTQSSSPSSHSSPTNELRSSHAFKSLTSYAVFLSTHHIVSSLRIIHDLDGLRLHQSSRDLIPLPSTSSAVHPFGSFTASIVFLFNHHIDKYRLICLPPTSSTVHSFKSFSTSTKYTVFLFDYRIAGPFK